MILDTQLQTQQKLNEVRVVFTLKRNQLPFHQENDVTSGNAQLLAFSNQTWNDLKHRIEELKSERSTHKLKFK